MEHSIQTITGGGNPLEALEMALQQEIVGGKNKLEMDFREAYPLLERHIAQRMRKRKLMDQFNIAYKHELNLVQFRKLLNAEREHRRLSDDMPVCASCGRPLAPPVSSDSREGEQ